MADFERRRPYTGNGPSLNPPEHDPLGECSRCHRIVDQSNEPLIPQTGCCSSCRWCEPCVEADRIEREEEAAS